MAIETTLEPKIKDFTSQLKTFVENIKSERQAAAAERQQMRSAFKGSMRQLEVQENVADYFLDAVENNADTMKGAIHERNREEFEKKAKDLISNLKGNREATREKIQQLTRDFVQGLKSHSN